MSACYQAGIEVLMSTKLKKSQSIQSKGGSARAASMTPDQRKELAREAAVARWAARDEALPVEERMPRATHAGEMDIGGTKIACAVLDDGRRVLTQDGFLGAIGRRGRITWGGKLETPPFLAFDSLKGFVSDELRRNCRPIVYRPMNAQGRAHAYGFVADVLPEVCEVYLRARDAKVLAVNQAGIARACEVLVRGLARVGIVALVDEATGYQRDRDRHELHKILELFIAKELLPWTRRFPDEFYKEMFRLRGWKTYDHNAAQGPRFAGTLTNQLVYERLPPGVLDELRKKNPATGNRRKHAHHQFLTENIGNPHLERHIASVTTLMRAARTWAELEDMASRALPPRALPAPDSDPQLRTLALDE